MTDKFLLWIDDGNEDMEQVARGAFIELWKEGIYNKTIFFGDFKKRTTKQELEIFKNTVISLFLRLYRTCNNSSIEYVSKNNAQLQTLFDEYFNPKYDEQNKKEIADCIPSDDENEFSDSIISLINSWKELDSREILRNSEKTETNAIYCVDKIFDIITTPEKYSYAIDVVLLEDDERKLNCENGKSLPVISMELYHYITKRLNSPCLLYSRYTYLNRLQDNWKDLYANLYNEKLSSINIISRDDLYHGSLNESTIRCFKNLFQGEEET